LAGFINVLAEREQALIDLAEDGIGEL